MNMAQYGQVEDSTFTGRLAEFEGRPPAVAWLPYQDAPAPIFDPLTEVAVKQHVVHGGVIHASWAVLPKTGLVRFIAKNLEKTDAETLAILREITK